MLADGLDVAPFGELGKAMAKVAYTRQDKPLKCFFSM